MIDNLFMQIHSRKVNRKYKVEIFANDNIHYRNKQRIIRKLKRFTVTVKINKYKRK